MNALDRHIVNSLQDGLSVCERPFAALAEELAIAEEAIVERLADLLDAGVLSRFGPMFDAERMGGAFHLCAMAVRREDFDAIAELVNAYPEVAHNYEREHELNMWFVLGSDDESSISQTIARIEMQTGCHVYDLPKLREYYVGLRLAADAIQSIHRNNNEESTCA